MNYHTEKQAKASRVNFTLKLLAMFLRMIDNHIAPAVDELSDNTVRELLLAELTALKKMVAGIDTLIRSVTHK